VIVLDTHALLWVAEDDRRLGRQTRRLVDRELQSGRVAYCALSIWEIDLLIHGRRLRLVLPTLAWRSGLLAKGFVELAADGLMAATAASFFGALRDPMDCLIAASALTHDATLVTADARILAWTQGPRLHDAST
jgi:PIN domain nuclease of toxin-antitoxin system